MLLSLEFERLKGEESSYEPSDEVKRQMSEKSLIALIGPSAVGKSTITKEIIRIGGTRFSEVLTSTTRRRKENDPAGYQTADEGFNIEHALELVHQRAVTNYAIHPSGNIYTTLPSGFPAEYNILPMLPGSVEAMRKSGFKKVYTFYIVTSVEALEKQLADRVEDPSFAARLSEGRDSLVWALAHKSELSFIENTYGEPEKAAQQVIALLDAPQSETEREQGSRLVEAMLAYIDSALPAGETF